MREEMPRWVNGFFAITGGRTLIGSVAVLIAAIAQSFPDDPPSAKCTWVTAPGTKADTNCHQIVDKLVQCGNPKGYRFEETSLRRTVAMAASSGSQFYLLSATAPLPADSTVLGTVENGLDIIDGASELVIDSTSVA
jgi:hypothetical protein